MLFLSTVFSLILQWLSYAKRALFRWGWRKSVRAGRPVVSIGNLSFGGTGKTPVVIALCRALTERGLRVAVLTRGYRRQKSQPTEVVRPDSDPAVVGDEPLLIARATSASVIVDAKRTRSAAFAVAHLAPDVLILDDGFSHLQLHRDFDWLMLAANDGHWFARRRELRRTWQTAALIASLEPTVAGAPASVVHLSRQPTGWRSCLGSHPVEFLRGRQVTAMAAIAHPERFTATLAALDIEAQTTRFYHDHHRFPPGMLEAEAKLRPVVITEKDAIKIGELPANVYVLMTEVALPESIVERVVSLTRVSQP